MESAGEDDPDPLYLSPPLYTYALLTAAQTIGWPEEPQIRTIWDETDPRED